MVSPRILLNQLKWTGEDMAELLICYRHRGAPGDERTIRGDQVTALGRSFFEFHDSGSSHGAAGAGASAIPYHRVLRIERRGVVLFDRATRDHGAADRRPQADVRAAARMEEVTSMRAPRPRRHAPIQPDARRGWE